MQALHDAEEALECAAYCLHEKAGSSPKLFSNSPKVRDEDRNELEPQRRRVERRVQCAEQPATARWRLELRVGEAGKEGSRGSDLPDELSRLAEPVVVASRKGVVPSSLTGWHNTSGSVEFFRAIVTRGILTTPQRSNAMGGGRVPTTWRWVVAQQERPGRMRRLQGRTARR